MPLTQPLSWHCPKALYMYIPSFVLLNLPWASCLQVAVLVPARTHAVQPSPMRHVQSITNNRAAHLEHAERAYLALVGALHVHALLGPHGAVRRRCQLLEPAVAPDCQPQGVNQATAP